VTVASTVTQKISAARLVAIVRLDDPTLARSAIGALASGGIDLVELSLTSPTALGAIRSATLEFPSMTIGAGTVLTGEDAAAAVGAGAKWLVSPNMDPSVIRWAIEHDVLHIPGALSPTEIAAARAAGATLIKLFPADVVGPGYVEAVRAPFPEVQLVATGGVDQTNASEFLAAGAVAVAVGGALVNPATAREPELLAETAKRLREAILSATAVSEVN
jgi:2-dehydro-3-deoxyphosphogluconate aldolase/(4S)-4-hydroxy-2-oxoglutarate aldolase